jgi:hypothetical protein
MGWSCRDSGCQGDGMVGACIPREILNRFVVLGHLFVLGWGEMRRGDC